ncbi:hypothetical protein HCG51_22880 [Tolypothrix sp. PCC 7910]|uniref:hypothetical protein n=1 Tax=Tolypothrix sp. PCC 7910 TaxID=2099387 RepID=UPI001427829C|nr:hypothetical protein [Tolypothrix sp. PCC 7910]QIR39273.1 hypothetical protein HCG51_22880 [Tolypothrix sp. PCC 7910]
MFHSLIKISDRILLGAIAFIFGVLLTINLDSFKVMPKLRSDRLYTSVIFRKSFIQVGIR